MIPKPERWVPVLEAGFKDIRLQQAWSYRKLLIHIEFSYSFLGGLPGVGPQGPAAPCWPGPFGCGEGLSQVQ